MKENVTKKLKERKYNEWGWIKENVTNKAKWK